MNIKIIIFIFSLIFISCNENKKVQDKAVSNITTTKNADTLPYSIGQALWYVGESNDSILENAIVKFKGVKNGKILLESYSGEFSPKDFVIAKENEQCLD